MNEVFIILGSNIDPLINVNTAIELLKKDEKIEVVKVSQFYETLPTHEYGSNFINVAVKIKTILDAEKLKTTFRVIEKKMGRVRTDDRNEARPIDIDIVFFGDLITDLIPDPDFLKYAHIAIPIIELDPTFVHPVSKKQISFYKEKFSEEIGKTIFQV